MGESILIADYNYDLPEARIAKFPLEDRSASKLLLYSDNKISEDKFSNILQYISQNDLVVFNNTKVVRARLIFHKATGARIEIFCLDPCEPADYERAFAVTRECTWHCMVGNLKKFNAPLTIDYEGFTLTAERAEGDGVVRFSWNSPHSFGQLLELLGRIPIPPYLGRESQEIDTTRYQTTYAKFEGSVAAPTAGLHFTDEIVANIEKKVEVTLHVGAGTFLPVKELDAMKHKMHVEFFDVTRAAIEVLAASQGNIIAVGTTTVRTLESLAVLGHRVQRTGSLNCEQPIGQWEAYDFPPENIATKDEFASLLRYMNEHNIEKLYGSTQIMIKPGYKFRTIKGIVTNFHQPQSTLLLLITAVVGQRWREIYCYAMDHDFRFLSYGDSSLLMCSQSNE